MSFLKRISLLRYRKSFFSFSQSYDCTYQKSKVIFFLKGGMGKKSYYCNFSIQALFHILYLVILLQFLAIARQVGNLKSDFLKKGSWDFFLLLDLSCPHINEKKLLQSFFWQIFCCPATTVDRCEAQRAFASSSREAACPGHTGLEARLVEKNSAQDETMPIFKLTYQSSKIY